MAFLDLHEGILESFAERSAVRFKDDFDPENLGFTVIDDPRDPGFKEKAAKYMRAYRKDILTRDTVLTAQRLSARRTRAALYADPVAHREHLRAEQAKQKERRRRKRELARAAGATQSPTHGPHATGEGQAR